jgi:hypothetical protein
MVNSVIAMTVTLAMTGYTIPGAPLVGSKRAAVAMGGFQQKEFSVGGARLSLIVGSSGVAPEEWPELCRDEGRTGVVYGLSDGRVEIVAEGERASLEALISKVHSSTPSEMVNLRETWQLPVGGYQAAFPVFILEPKMRADISLRCEDTGNLDYIARHSQIEAVFNRGLKLSKSREHPQQLDMVVVGDSGRPSLAPTRSRWTGSSSREVFTGGASALPNSVRPGPCMRLRARLRFFRVRAHTLRSYQVTRRRNFCTDSYCR